MKVHSLCVFFILAVENIFKGLPVSAAGTYMKKKHIGLVPSGPHVGYSVSLNKCLVLCGIESTCKAVFYTRDTSECRLRSSIYYDVADFDDSASTDYYEDDNAPAECPADVNKFNAVLLEIGTVFSFRVFLDPQFHIDASNICVNDHGGTLVRTFTPAKHNFLGPTMDECGFSGRYWADVTNQFAADYEDLDQWTAMDGSAISTTFWKNGEPGIPDQRHCVRLAMSRLLEWMTAYCDLATEYYICEN